MKTKAEEVKVVEKEAVEKKEPKRKQAKSISYTLKAIKAHIETLEEAGMINEKEATEMRRIKDIAVSNYIADKF